MSDGLVGLAVADIWVGIAVVGGLVGLVVASGLVGIAVAGGLVGLAVADSLVGIAVVGSLLDAIVADGLEVFFSGVGVNDGVEDGKSVIFTSLFSSETTGVTVAVKEELVPTSPSKIIGVFVLV